MANQNINTGGSIINLYPRSDNEVFNLIENILDKFTIPVSIAEENRYEQINISNISKLDLNSPIKLNTTNNHISCSLKNNVEFENLKLDIFNLLISISLFIAFLNLLLFDQGIYQGQGLYSYFNENSLIYLVIISFIWLLVRIYYITVIFNSYLVIELDKIRNEFRIANVNKFYQNQFLFLL